MAGDDSKRGADANVTRLTRALLLGASLGTISLVQVGCAPVGDGTAGAAARAVEALPERELCDRVLETRDPRLLEDLLRTYPRSRCVNPVLGAMPPQTLTQVSPAVLAGLPGIVRARIPRQAAVHLRFPTEPQERDGREDDRDRDDSNGPY